MALNKEKVQDLIDDFVVNNVDQINEVAAENPIVYDAVIDALNLLSRKFGTIQAINVPKPAAPIAPKGIALYPIVQQGAIFVDVYGEKLEVVNIDLGKEEVTFNNLENDDIITRKFFLVNSQIDVGTIKLYEKTPLNLLIKVGSKFLDKRTTREYEFVISNIDYPTETIQQTDFTNGNIKDFTFEKANELVVNDIWVPVAKTKPKAIELNPLVDIDEIFEEKGEMISIADIDFDKEIVTFNKENVKTPMSYSFQLVNKLIEDGEWEHKPSTQVQSFTININPLDPSVQVGQKYLDLEDNSNFSVLAIDEKNDVVTINWNEDDVQEDVSFEDFNDYLEAATWILAPDQTQGAATEAEILEAIEGLELIGDAESKKEIAELKKQLKQLKKKKP
jgi:hypothetical protein